MAAFPFPLPQIAQVLHVNITMIIRVSSGHGQRWKTVLTLGGGWSQGKHPWTKKLLWERADKIREACRTCDTRMYDFTRVGWYSTTKFLYWVMLILASHHPSGQERAHQQGWGACRWRVYIVIKDRELSLCSKVRSKWTTLPCRVSTASQVPCHGITSVGIEKEGTNTYQYSQSSNLTMG